MAAGYKRGLEVRIRENDVIWAGRLAWPFVSGLHSNLGPKLTARQLAKAKGFMLCRLSTHLSIGDVASMLSVSKCYFVRSFTNTVGVAPYSWLVAQRINEARYLLSHTSLPLAEIALACGFTDQSHFTNSFNKRVGTTPSRWRKGQGCGNLQVPWESHDFFKFEKTYGSDISKVDG